MPVNIITQKLTMVVKYKSRASSLLTTSFNKKRTLHKFLDIPLYNFQNYVFSRDFQTLFFTFWIFQLIAYVWLSLTKNISVNKRNYSAVYLQCWAYYNKWGCGVHTAYWHRDAACCWHQLLQNTLSDFSTKRDKIILIHDITKQSLPFKNNNKKTHNRLHPLVMLHRVHGYTQQVTLCQTSF